MFWEFIGAILTPFNHAWEYWLVYAVGWYVTTIALLRFGPRQCKKTEPGIIKESAWKDGGKGKPSVYVPDVYGMVPLSDDDCMKAWHWNHVMLRQQAVYIGLFWPIIFYGFIPVAALVLAVKSFYTIGRVESIYPGDVK